ncbi:hypothetical protein ACRRTK_012118 [Alexandromys fortis]
MRICKGGFVSLAPSLLWAVPQWLSAHRLPGDCSVHEAGCLGSSNVVLQAPEDSWRANDLQPVLEG